MSRTNDLGQDRISRLVIRLAIPTMLAQLVNVLYSIVDRMYIGTGVGSLALAGVGVCAPIVTLLTSFGSMVGQGGAPIMAMQMGSGDHKSAKQTLNNGFFMLLVLSAVLTGLFLLTKDQLLMWFGASETTFSYANTYVTIYTAGTFFALISGGLNSFLIAQGFSGLGMATVVLGAVLNIILDPVFIFIFHMGVAGAAIATISSQFFSACMVVYALTHTEDMYKLVWSKVRIDGRMLQRIVRIGIPAGMQSVMYNISNIIIQSGVNTLGTDNVTAWATYGKVDGLYWMMINALGISVTTFVGQNYGAGRMDRVHKGAGACMIIGTIMTAIVSTLLYLKGYLLIDLFTSDAQVQEIGLSLIHFLVPTLITYITIEILSGTLRGVGDAWMPLIMTGIGVCCLRVIWIIFFLPQYRSILAAAFCYPLSWTITSIAFVIYYFFFSSLRRVDGRKWFQKKDY